MLQIWSVWGPAVCNRYAREQDVPNVDNMVAKNPSGVRDDPSRPQSLDGQLFMQRLGRGKIKDTSMILSSMTECANTAQL